MTREPRDVASCRLKRKKKKGQPGVQGEPLKLVDAQHNGRRRPRGKKTSPQTNSTRIQAFANPKGKKKGKKEERPISKPPDHFLISSEAHSKRRYRPGGKKKKKAAVGCSASLVR